MQATLDRIEKPARLSLSPGMIVDALYGDSHEVTGSIVLVHDRGVVVEPLAGEHVDAHDHLFYAPFERVKIRAVQPPPVTPPADLSPLTPVGTYIAAYYGGNGNIHGTVVETGRYGAFIKVDEKDHRHTATDVVGVAWPDVDVKLGEYGQTVLADLPEAEGGEE